MLLLAWMLVFLLAGSVHASASNLATKVHEEAQKACAQLALRVRAAHTCKQLHSRA
jgi:hypothetical protein